MYWTRWIERCGWLIEITPWQGLQQDIAIIQPGNATFAD
jgi:hypothetical protein